MSWAVPTRDDRILIKIEEVFALVTLPLHLRVLLDDRLLMIAVIVPGDGVDIVVHEPLALEEVLPPLLLLDLLLTLVESEGLLVLGLHDIAFFELLEEPEELVG